MSRPHVVNLGKKVGWVFAATGRAERGAETKSERKAGLSGEGRVTVGKMSAT